jgi:1-deoxy-D-xylulose-5-phosphate reductoisomerase
MIETVDSEIYAQLGPNDMCIPIQNAVFYPDLRINNYNEFDFSKNVSLEFCPVDMDKYKMLKFAYQCGKNGGLFPVFFNSVNETLVYLFLDNKISFLDIEKYMENSIYEFDKYNEINKNELTIDNIRIVEKQADIIVNRILKEF